MSIRLCDLVIAQEKSKIKAGEGKTKGDYKFFTSSNIQTKYVDFFQYDKPALIFGTGGIPSVHYCDEPFSTSTDCIVFYAKNNRYFLKSLYLFFESHMNLLEEGFHGAGLQHISKKYLLEIQMPDIPIEYQLKINDIVDRLNRLINIRKKQLENYDIIVKSRFIEMFGDPDKNEKGYITKKLETLANKISDGVHSKPIYTETGKPFISVVNINRGIINFDKCKFVSEADYQKMIKSTHPEMGDVLYTKVGATYGIPAYVDTNKAFCLYVSVCLIKPKSEKINGKFLALSMRMPYVKRQADSRIKGIGVPDLHLNQIKKFDILCPPIKEQKSYVAFSEQVDKSKFECSISMNLLKSFTFCNHLET